MKFKHAIGMSALLFIVYSIFQTAQAQCLWEGVLKANVDNQIYGAVPYKGGLAVIVRGDYSIFGTLDPPISYIGIVQGDSLDTLTASFGPQSGTNSRLLRHIVSFDDTLMIHGYYNEIDSVLTNTSTHFYTDSGIINPVPFGMSRWQDGLYQDQDAGVIFMFPYLWYIDTTLGNIGSNIQLYRNGNFELYDTFLFDNPVFDPLPEFEMPVMFEGEVLVINRATDFDMGHGIYYLNRDSLRWMMDKPITSKKASMIMWNNEVYLSNSDGKIWKRDDTGWSTFYESADTNRCVRDLYVFKNELYVMEGEQDYFGNCYITDVSIYRDGGLNSLSDGGIQLSEDYEYRQGSFTDDGEYLYIYAEEIRIESCDLEAYSLYRLAIPLSVDEVITDKTTLQIYPNPANSTLTLTKEGQSAARVFFYNIAGVQVNAIKLTGTEEIDISSWPAGVYFYRMGGEMGKVVIAR